jgi:hypothetical protein
VQVPGKERTINPHQYYYQYLVNKEVPTAIYLFLFFSFSNSSRPLSHYMIVNATRTKESRKHTNMYVMCKEQTEKNKIDYNHYYSHTYIEEQIVRPKVGVNSEIEHLL